MKNDPLKVTRESYDSISSEYIKKRDKNKKWNEISMKICDNFLSKINFETGKILVVGCAGGNSTFYMAGKTKHKIYAIDFSKEMIKNCKLRKKKKKITNCYFKFGNIIDFKIDKKFDGIFCDGVLYHISDKKISSVLRKLRTSLNKNGILYANFKQGKGFEILDNPASFPGHKRAYWYYSLKELKNIFSKAGLKAKITKPKISLFGEKYYEVNAFKK